jgi:triacylglycerol lipase
MKQSSAFLLTTLLLATTACQASPQFTPLGNRPAPISQLTTFNANATGSFQVVKATPGKIWANLELLRQPGLPEERMQARGRQQDPEVVSCFGTELPASTDVCLHDAGAPAQLKSPIPVLLVHGANVNATTNWATPPYTDRKSGVMQHLKAQGYRVFAVTFANKHGDNHTWVRHIHNATTRIRQITGAPQVDAIGHSKGGFALRMYTSNIVPNGQAPYTKTLRKALFIGSPQRGLDYTFRNSVVHWALLPEKDDAVLYSPVVWTKTLIMGSWKDTTQASMLGPYFKGQAQMIARLDKEFPLNRLTNTNPDWYTTYYGGQGFVSVSPGIDKVIEAGGNMVERLRRSPVDPAIQVGLLAGNKANMPGILNESSGPSDGIALVYSAAAAEDLTAAGAKLLSREVLPLHHMALVSDPKALDWISAQLQK